MSKGGFRRARDVRCELQMSDAGTMRLERICEEMVKLPGMSAFGLNDALALVIEVGTDAVERSLKEGERPRIALQ